MILQPVAHDIPAGLTTLTKPIPRGTGEHVARLTRWFESTFDCREGLKRAWTHVPAITAEAQRVEDLEKREPLLSAAEAAFMTEFFKRDRAGYLMIGFGCEGGPEQEERLCRAVKNAMYTLLGDPLNLRPTLYWRRKPECDYQTAANWDFDTNRPGNTPARARITARIAVPSCTERLVRVSMLEGCPVVELPT